MNTPESKNYDVCIIGAGLAGMAATVFAVHRDMTCVQVGSIGEINFATGLLDLISVHPASKKHVWKDPWAGIDALSQDIPDHPYARLKKEDIQAAFDELLSFLEGVGLHTIDA